MLTTIICYVAPSCSLYPIGSYVTAYSLLAHIRYNMGTYTLLDSNIASYSYPSPQQGCRKQNLIGQAKVSIHNHLIRCFWTAMNNYNIQ